MRLWRSRSDDERREAMVERQIRHRGVADERVLEAMRTVPRHLFIPLDRRSQAYHDMALPIGAGATISQPYIVARMTEALDVEGGSKVLEVGTGSGYQAGILVAMGCEVFSVERVPELRDRAGAALTEAGLVQHVHLRVGDGAEGWPEEAPFDRVLLTAAPPAVPGMLIEQLRTGGVLVAPVGDLFHQVIWRYRKEDEGVVRERVEAARFVPLVRGDGDSAREGDSGE